MAASEKYGWGVWLAKGGEWAVLPSRMCKPTPHNCDLNAGLIDVAREHDAKGEEPEIKRIPARLLKSLRAEHTQRKRR